MPDGTAGENPLPGYEKVSFVSTPYMGFGVIKSGHLPEDKVREIAAILDQYRV